MDHQAQPDALSNARVQPVPAARRSLLLRIARWFARRRFGRVPTPVDAYAHSPALLAAVGGFELAIDRADRVDPRLKAIAELKVAALVGCPFCLDIGSSLARRKGVTDLQVGDLAQYRTSKAFSELERGVLELATRMTETPVRVSDALIGGLREHLGDRGVVELAGAIAWENFRARINHALGLQAQGFSAGAVCALPESRQVSES